MKKDPKKRFNKENYSKKEKFTLFSLLINPIKEPGFSTFYDPNKKEQESLDEKLRPTPQIKSKPKS